LGAGSVILKDVPDYTTVAGATPARIMKKPKRRHSCSESKPSSQDMIFIGTGISTSL